MMRDQHIAVIMAANFYDHTEVNEVAQRTGATAVIVPQNTDGAPGVRTYFDLMNRWVSSLARAFAASTGTR